MFWQKTSHPIELVTGPVFQQKVGYIHQNPVKSGLFKDEGSYTYSSACFESPLKMNE
jgi:putative transposase